MLASLGSNWRYNPVNDPPDSRAGDAGEARGRSFAFAFLDPFEDLDGHIVVLVRREVAIDDVEAERRPAGVFPGLLRGLDSRPGAFADHVGLELGNRAHDIEKGALVGAVLAGLEGEVHIEDMQAGGTLVDDRLDGGRKVAHGSGETRDLEDDHAGDLAGTDLIHEALVTIALGVPASSGILVDLDSRRVDIEITAGSQSNGTNPIDNPCEYLSTAKHCSRTYDG